MCCDRSLEQVRGAEVLPSLFGMLSETVHLSNPCPFSLSRPSSFISPAGTCPYVCLYRPPPSRKNKLSNQLFLQEFPEFLTQFAGHHSDLVLLGDFNFHYDDCADTQVNRLKTMLSDHGLTQLVDVPTHRCGHTLDWAVVRSDVSCLVLERVDDMPGLSDHKSLLCQMTITAPSKSKRTVTSRNTKAVSLTDFQTDVKCFTDCYSQCPDRDLVDCYSAGLRAVMDRHAPLVNRCVSHRRSAPWLTHEIREARRRRRQA